MPAASAHPARRMLQFALILLACVLTMLCWMREEIANGFTMLIGDWLDGRIQISITQHWPNVFRGLERWNVMAYFYPWPDTLGYNDGYLLFGVVFAVARGFGADPFLGFEATDCAMRAVGFLSCCAFAVEALGLGLGWALLAAAVFTISNSLYIQEGHSQLLAVCFAPLLGWLIWRVQRDLRARARLAAILWGGGAAGLYGAWLLSGFYMAWFTTFFGLLTVLALIAGEATGNGVGWAAWRGLLQWPLVPIAAMATICLVPFLLVYLPKAAETGGHPFSEAMIYSPSLIDLVHIGPGNQLFGWLDQWMTDTLRPGFPAYNENNIGVPPLLAVFSLAGAVQGWRGHAPRPALWRAISIATTLSVILFVHVRGHTLWYGIYEYFPGARAVRVVARFALFLALPLTLLAVGFLASQARRWPAWISWPCIAILLLEELTYSPSIGMNRAAEMRLLNAVPPAPSSCRVFYVSAPWPRPPTGNPDVERLYPQNVDAMLIAEERALPTINGYATFNPPDWNFDAIRRPDYGERVHRYASDHAITGLCALDLTLRRWIIEPSR